MTINQDLVDKKTTPFKNELKQVMEEIKVNKTELKDQLWILGDRYGRNNIRVEGIEDDISENCVKEKIKSAHFCMMKS